MAQIDKEAMEYYKNEIAPLIFTLKNKCRKAKMPMFFGVCIDPGKVLDDKTNITFTKDPVYKYDMVTPYYCNLNTTPDVISECIKVTRGFHAVPVAGLTEDIDYLQGDEEE